MRQAVPMSETVKGPASYFPSIEKKYGRPVAEWQDLIRASPLTKHRELVDWLKAEHGLGHGHANALSRTPSPRTRGASGGRLSPGPRRPAAGRRAVR